MSFKFLRRMSLVFLTASAPALPALAQVKTNETQTFSCHSDDLTRQAVILDTNRPSQTIMPYFLFHSSEGPVSNISGFMDIDFEAAKSSAQTYCSKPNHVPNLNVLFENKQGIKMNLFGRSCYNREENRGAQISYNGVELTYRLLTQEFEGTPIESHTRAAHDIHSNEIIIPISSQQDLNNAIPKYTTIMQDHCFG